MSIATPTCPPLELQPGDQSHDLEVLVDRNQSIDQFRRDPTIFISTIGVFGCSESCHLSNCPWPRLMHGRVTPRVKWILTWKTDVRNGVYVLTSSGVYKSAIGRPDSVVNSSCRRGMRFKLSASVVRSQSAEKGGTLIAKKTPWSACSP